MFADDENETVYENIFGIAITVFSNIDRALSWMNAPCKELGGEVPIYMLETDAGIQQVKAELDRILNSPVKKTPKALQQDLEL